MLLAALPWLLLLVFVSAPMVSSAAFRAFSCEEFDNGRGYYLRADYAIDCSDMESYKRVELLAWLGILLYPVGTSVLYTFLILASRRAILDDKPTSLSAALGFLVRDYKPTFMWWELLMLWRQLWLVGFAILIRPGTVEQLVICFLVVLSHMLLHAVAMPFKNDGDNYVGQACNFALTGFFFFLLVIKFDVLTDSVDYALSEQLREKYQLNVSLVSLVMIGFILLALVSTTAMAAHQILQAARVPTIRLQRTGEPPELPFAKGNRWHMFLSHIWATGQDQCATIKRMLAAMLPGVSVFLDVDNLRSIDTLEEEISDSAVVMILATKGYFQSKNCLREVNATLEQEKRFCVGVDLVRGGAPLPDIEAECSEEMQLDVFGPPSARREVIIWHRIKAFQMVSITLITEQLLLGGPRTGNFDKLDLFVPGELPRQRLMFRRRIVVFASPNNPGALGVAKDLALATGNCIEVTSDETNAMITHFLLYLNTQVRRPAPHRPFAPTPCMRHDSACTLPAP